MYIYVYIYIPFLGSPRGLPRGLHGASTNPSRFPSESLQNPFRISSGSLQNPFGISSESLWNHFGKTSLRATLFLCDWYSSFCTSLGAMLFL